MKEEKIVFLEAQMEEKASLNHQLQNELQVVRAGRGGRAWVLAMRSPPHPFQPLSWVAEGQPGCSLPGAGVDEPQSSEAATSESSTSGLHRTREWRRGQKEKAGSEQHRVCWARSRAPRRTRVNLWALDTKQAYRGSWAPSDGAHRHTGAHKVVHISS